MKLKYIKLVIQKLFSCNKPIQIIKITHEGKNFISVYKVVFKCKKCSFLNLIEIKKTFIIRKTILCQECLEKYIVSADIIKEKIQKISSPLIHRDVCYQLDHDIALIKKLDKNLINNEIYQLIDIFYQHWLLDLIYKKIGNEDNENNFCGGSF